MAKLPSDQNHFNFIKPKESLFTRLLNFFGLVTFKQMNNRLYQSELHYNQLIESYRKNVALLYSEVTTDMRRLDKKIKNIKPVLKIEDEEATRFIKEVLSKHDQSINNQQNTVNNKIVELRQMETKANKAISLAQDATDKVNNIMNGLGLTDSSYLTNKLWTGVKEIIVKAKSQDK